MVAEGNKKRKTNYGFMNHCLKPIICKDLAEELGIHVGDGHMAFRNYPRCKCYEYSISGNSNEEEYFGLYVKSLIKRLYNINMHLYKRKDRNELKLQCKSKELFYFKRSIGLPNGKKDRITIPTIVLESNYLCDFLRGLFDTDGHLRFYNRNKKRPPYPRLDITSKSFELIDQVNQELIKLGFTTYIIEIHSVHPKTKTLCHSKRIFIYGWKNLQNWIKLIGFSNKKSLIKIEDPIIKSNLEKLKLQAGIAPATSASL